MANDFCPMRVIVKGEEQSDAGFLPDRNYVEINGKKCPLGHCFTLELPLGSCEIEVHTPPPNTIRQASTVVKENQLYCLTLTINETRDIVDASFAVDDVTEDPWGLYANDRKWAITNREKTAEWRARQKQQPEAPSQGSGYAASKPGGGKAIGWGLVIMLICILGIVLCYTGEIEIEATAITEDFSLSNLAVYYGGAAIGLITFVCGLLIRKADS